MLLVAIVDLVKKYQASVKNGETWDLVKLKYNETYVSICVSINH